VQYLIVFTRYPEPGKTKTRLIPALGEVGAAKLQRQMTEYTLSLVTTHISTEVRFAGGDMQLMRDWLGSELIYQEQGEGELGVRMARSLSSAFSSGATQTIIIGTDCPSLNAEILTTAFHQLQQHDLVLGPALDGGYYLIGLQRFIPELFIDINWGTDQVLAQTVKIAQYLDLSVFYLPKLADIDRPEDLAMLDSRFDSDYIVQM
jgi:uncharacterized protein